MVCGVDFVLFKPLYVKIAFIAIFLIFHHMSHSKLSAKAASEDCIPSNLSNPSNPSSIRLVWQVS